MELRAGYKLTEVGVIPTNWSFSTLGELATIKDGTHQTPKYVPTGVPFYSVEHVTSGNFNNTKFISLAEHRFLTRFFKIEKGDILMTRIGSIGDCKLVDWDVDASFYVSLALLKIRPPNSARFISHFSKSAIFQSEVELNSLQSAIPRKINLGPISNVKVILPPIDEQEAIAEALSDADVLIESLDQLITKKRHLKQGAMQELLTGKRRLPGFSGVWEVKSLGEIAQPRKERVDPRIAGECEFCVELEHVGQGTGNLVGYTVAGKDASLKSVFIKDDVLFGKLRAYLRKYWLASREGVCSTEIWALVARRTLLVPSFLLQLVQTDRFIEAASSSYGTHMPRSDWGVVRVIEISLPSIAEQTAIATILSDMDTELAELQSRLAKASQIKQGMMQELLTGRIRLL